MKKRTISLLLTVFLLMGLTAGCQKQGTEISEASLDEIEKGGFTVAASCHDPQIMKGEEGKYYMFGSHMTGAESENLRDWSYFAEGVDGSNPLFDGLFSENPPAFSFVGKNTEDGYSVWAPDVVYNETMGKYVMYFCTTSSYIKSNLCFAVADSPKGPYAYVDTILYSGFGESDADQTNLKAVLGEGAEIDRYLEYGGYNNKKWPNCIDPSVFTDEDGKMWMVYGSWSGGIFLLEIDKSTGYPVFPQEDEKNGVDAYYGKRLAGGGHHSIEGPYIQYEEESGYYYLFVSYGELTSDGGYQIRQFRSRQPDGPYVDAAGNTLEGQEDHFNYGLKMAGNYTFPSLNYTYMAPGGQSAFRDEDGKCYLAYHQRFDDGTEYFEPRVHQMFQNKQGWFVMAPFALDGKSQKEEGYRTEDLQGTFYVVNHETDISSKVQESQPLVFEQDGTVTGEETGTYSVEEGTSFLTVTLGEDSYEGVILEMEDEAGNPVLCFTACGANNETIWGVHYLKK